MIFSTYRLPHLFVILDTRSWIADKEKGHCTGLTAGDIDIA
jgi:hypothetical protein